ncbi:MAG: hypothetical protein JSW63_05400 [Ignavibacterium sp.]|nr:MAG: hypothetical protein JSW63_05400 [Ignavibacterium sp.]
MTTNCQLEMPEETNKKQAKFGDYIYILYKWRKLLLINMIIITAGATVYSFLIPEQFKATSIVMVSQSSSDGMGGIGSIISGGGIGAVGAQLFGITSPSQGLYFEILGSRTALTEVINKFNLIDYYSISDRNMDKTLKSFSGDVIFEPTENGMIEISVINEDPILSAQMANYFVNLADSINIELNIEQAKNSRIFIEKRYRKNIEDLANAEDSMYKFQKKYGIFAVPEQLEASVKAAAEMEALLAQQELALELIKQQSGTSSPLYINLANQIDVIKRKVNELKNSRELSYPSNVLFPFSEVPDLTINYYRIFREIEIQSKIMEFVLPMYEQAKVEEQKSIPSLIVVDKAVPPQLKHSPKKAFIILLFFFLGLFIHLPIIFLADRIITSETPENPLEVREKKFFLKIASIYRIKF